MKYKFQTIFRIFNQHNENFHLKILLKLFRHPQLRFPDTKFNKVQLSQITLGFGTTHEQVFQTKPIRRRKEWKKCSNLSELKQTRKKPKSFYSELLWRFQPCGLPASLSLSLLPTRVRNFFFLYFFFYFLKFWFFFLSKMELQKLKSRSTMGT